MFPCEQKTPHFQKDKKSEFEISMPTKRQSICLPLSPTRLPLPSPSLPPPPSPKHKRVTNTLLGTRGDSPSPTINPCRRALSLHN